MILGLVAGSLLALIGTRSIPAARGR